MTATTTEVKHTPLPWSYHPICDAGTRIIAGKQGPPVAYMPDPGAYGVGYISEHAANAELIIRAVNSHAEMLQLCKDSLDIMVNQFGFDEGADIVIDLRAAIAKAEG